MPSPDLHLVPLDGIPEPPYRTPAENLPLLYSTAKKMQRLCEESDGLGMAAAQVGLPWRLFVARHEHPDSEVFGIFFDCEYSSSGPSIFSSVEGCLSLPGRQYRVPRHESVVVSGKRIVEDEEGFRCEDFSSEFSGVAAVLMQHEIDHDHGRHKMIDSIGSPVVIAWR